MTIKVKEINKYFFVLSYFCFLAFSIMGHIDILKNPLKQLTNLSLILLAISIFLQIENYTKKEFLYILIMLIISIVTIIKTNDYIFLKFTLLLSSIKNVEFEKCVKLDLTSRLFIIPIVFILYKIGIAKDIISPYNGIIRHSLGFTNPNSLGMHILIFSFDVLYLNKNKIPKTKILLMIFLLFFVDYFSGSRTTEIAMIISLILYLFYYNKKNILENRILKKVVCNSFALFTILTIIMYLSYLNGLNIGISLNEILSNRLYNIKYFFQMYNIGIFGKNLSMANLTLDNSYIYSILGLGIVVFSFYLIEFKRMFNWFYLKKEYLLIIILFSFMVYGIGERLWLAADYNIFILSFSKYFYKK